MHKQLNIHRCWQRVPLLFLLNIFTKHLHVLTITLHILTKNHQTISVAMNLFANTRHLFTKTLHLFTKDTLQTVYNTTHKLEITQVMLSSNGFVKPFGTNLLPCVYSLKNFILSPKLYS